MVRKPNYQFERHERERLKAQKTAAKAEARREDRERSRAAPDGSDLDRKPEGDG